MRITLAQTAPKLSRSNLFSVIKIINDCKDVSDLIVFPELSLNGYLLQDKLHEDAWNIEELQELEKLSEFIDIVIGGAMREGSVFRNAALYFSKGKLLSTHYKVHLPNYGMFEEARYFEAGNVFESFTTKYGKVSMLVCEDLWHESVQHDLVVENPDMIIALVASPARGFSDNGLEIEDKWMQIIKQVSSECSAKLVFVNRVGFEDGLGFWGGSCTLNKNGEVIDKLEYFKEIVKTIEI